MPIHLLPARFDLTGSSEDALDAEVGQIVVAGDTYEQDVAVVDENGDPFDAGTQVSPQWDIEASLRDTWVYDGGVVQADFTCVWTDAALGRLRISLTPAQTMALTVASGVWDMQLVNKLSGGNPGYAAGFTQTVLRGQWSLLKDATR